jgi:hypothetical protein
MLLNRNSAVMKEQMNLVFVFLDNILDFISEADENANKNEIVQLFIFIIETVDLELERSQVNRTIKFSTH